MIVPAVIWLSHGDVTNQLQLDPGDCRCIYRRKEYIHVREIIKKYSLLVVPKCHDVPGYFNYTMITFFAQVVLTIFSFRSFVYKIFFATVCISVFVAPLHLSCRRWRKAEWNGVDRKRLVSDAGVSRDMPVAPFFSSGPFRERPRGALFISRARIRSRTRNSYFSLSRRADGKQDIRDENLGRDFHLSWVSSLLPDLPSQQRITDKLFSQRVFFSQRDERASWLEGIQTACYVQPSPVVP